MLSPDAEVEEPANVTVRAPAEMALSGAIADSTKKM
jgi:hypothetical protein